jgi:hypothetical protein
MEEYSLKLEVLNRFVEDLAPRKIFAEELNKNLETHKTIIEIFYNNQPCFKEEIFGQERKVSYIPLNFLYQPEGAVLDIKITGENAKKSLDFLIHRGFEIGLVKIE